MNFVSGGTHQEPQFRSTDEDQKIEAARLERQAEWERARNSEIEANDGLPIDRRPLWVKLQEQKDKAQAEYDEQHDLKSMVQGLDEEEAAFLNKVVDMQDKMEYQRFSSEIDEIKQYRAAASQAVATVCDPSRDLQAAAAAAARRKPVKSQAALLSGLVKTKRRRTSSESEPPTKQSTESEKVSSGNQKKQTSTTSLEKKQPGTSPKASQVEPKETSRETTLMRASKVQGQRRSLPGLAAYSDESSSSESDEDT